MIIVGVQSLQQILYFHSQFFSLPLFCSSKCKYNSTVCFSKFAPKKCQIFFKITFSFRIRAPAFITNGNFRFLEKYVEIFYTPNSYKSIGILTRITRRSNRHINVQCFVQLILIIFALFISELYLHYCKIRHFIEKEGNSNKTNFNCLLWNENRRKRVKENNSQKQITYNYNEI